MSADDIVQEILAETKRRKRVWTHMQRKAKEALAAVQKEAKRRGVKGNDWVMGAYASETTIIEYEFRRDKENCYENVELHPTGKITAEMAQTTEKAYGGYPDLPEDAPEIFLKMAVKQLMENLYEYCEEQQS